MAAMQKKTVWPKIPAEFRWFLFIRKILCPTVSTGNSICKNKSYATTSNNEECKNIGSSFFISPFK